MEKIFALSAASVLMAAPAMAEQFVNLESNSSFQDGDYSSTRIDTQYGWQDSLGDKSKYYIQGGPSLKTPDGGTNETVFSGKVGGSVAATDNLGVYGEFSMATAKGAVKNGYGVKAGVKYSFW